MEFDQTSTNTSLGWGKEVIRFWWLWFHFQGHCIIKTLKDSKNELCVHSISWINRFNLTKLAQIHLCDWGKEVILVILISFSRSHQHFEIQILIVKSLCAHCLLNQWLEFYQTSTNTSLGQGKEVIRLWWPWHHFQGHYIIKTLKKSLVCTLSHESIDGIWPK